MTTPWKHRYAQRTQRMGSSAIRELLKLTQRPDIISFAGGLPAPELFPVEAFASAAERVLKADGRAALQYATTEGYLPLRQWIVDQMATYGIHASIDNVLITSGSQQALDLIGKLLINPGDLVLTERPTYLGALQAWNAYQAEFTSVPIDASGLRTDLLEEALTGGPKFMYILPNFQNPGGVTLPLERRIELVETADKYGVPIIEDDPYGELRYEGEHIPPLVVVDADRLNGRAHYSNSGTFMRGNVIYLSTFSKTLAPGLRLAWMVAPRDVIQQCVSAKQGVDLHTSIFTQMITYEVLKTGMLKEHVHTLRRVYRERRDLMLEMMETYFPPQVNWTRPDGGLFLWVTLPESVDTVALLPHALAHKVAYVPGTYFYPASAEASHLAPGHNTFRLNFSNAQPEQIESGIHSLGEMLETELGRDPIMELAYGV